MKTYQQPSAVIEGVEVFWIPGYEGFYSVSKCGRVWSHERVVIDCLGRAKKYGGLWIVLRPNTKGYPYFMAKKAGSVKTVYLHRIMATIFKLSEHHPDNWEVDHIDRNPLNNSLDNIRIVTRSQNGINRGAQKNNLSGLRGVSWNRTRNTWESQIKKSKKKLFIGYFSTKEEAGEAYDQVAQIVHGKFAQLNFPEKKQAQLPPDLLKKIERFIQRLA